MLYHLHELQRDFLNPLSVWAQATSELFSSPYSPLAYTPLSRRLAAGYDLLHRIGKHYDKPEFGLRTTTRRRQGSPGRRGSRARSSRSAACCISSACCRTKLAKRPADPRVLIVAPLSGHHATLLRDTVRALLPEHDVCITDWIDARLVPLAHGPFHLDDYVDYVIEFIRVLGPDVHVISVCQPTVPVLAAVSLMATAKDPKLPKIDDDDGRADRHAPQSDRGQRAGQAQALRVVREQRDLQGAVRRIRATCARSTRASCSTPASSR